MDGFTTWTDSDGKGNHIEVELPTCGGACTGRFVNDVDSRDCVRDSQSNSGILFWDFAGCTPCVDSRRDCVAPFPHCL